MAESYLTSIEDGPRNAETRRNPKRNNRPLHHDASTNEIDLTPTAPARSPPRQLTLWRQQVHRRGKQRAERTLYVREGNAFHRASSSQVLARANQVITRQFRPGYPVLKSPECARTFLQYRLANRTHEIFAVLLLDQQRHLIKYLELFRGTINGAEVHTREVVREALVRGARFVVLAHNHTSGSVVPSLNDKGVTERIKHAFAIFDIQVIDHILVGRSVISFAECGLME
jgi:DNA repair protein RadC